MNEAPGVPEILRRMEALGKPGAVIGMTRFGQRSRTSYGLTPAQLKKLAGEIGRDHRLAQQLWATGVHDARLLASLIDDPTLITPTQMERWARDFDSDVICDACCWGLFDQTPYAYSKSERWSARKEEFVKRASFVLMAGLAAHDAKADEGRLLRFLEVVRRESGDERASVKKAASWALAEIGKRNPKLQKAALETVDALEKLTAKSARWIAADAVKEMKAGKKAQR